MNDNTINAVPQPLPQSSNAAPAVVKVASLPPNIQPNTVISGQVVSTDNNQISIKTDQGIIVLDADINVNVGQQVNLKVQNVVQQSIPVPVAELLNISSDKVAKLDQVLLKPTSVENPQPIVTQKPVDPVIVHDPMAFEEYKPLQALILQMPNILNDETLTVMTKSLLQLPMQQPLPPSLQQGLEKFDQLVNLLSQANLFPSNTAQAAQTDHSVQQNIITILQQLLQPTAVKDIAANPLLSQEPHQFIQLQTVQPGENLSPNILVNIKDQLLTLLQPQLNTAQAEKPLGIMQSLIPSALTGLIEKANTAIQTALPNSTPAPQNNTTPKLPQLFTLPAIGLVLGLPSKEVPQLGNANLVLMNIPQQPNEQAVKAPQQLIGLLAPQENEQHTPLLPGTIIVAALKPQTEKTTGFVVLPQQLLPKIIEEFATLHPSLGETWPAMDDLFQQAISQSATQPQIANTLHQIIPSPQPQQLPPTMLFFLSVLKNNFTAQWIPEKALAGLEKLDKAALIKTLTQDLQAIKSRMEDPMPADSWRPLPIPLQVGDQLMRLQWFYRHPEMNYDQSSSGNEQEDSQKKRKTRFLLNVPKTSFGDIQIDGLVQEKNLDLILRTESILASQMENAIRGRYTAVLETTGMIGGINFQSGRAHYVHV